MKSYFKKQNKYYFSLPLSNGGKAASFKRVKMHQLKFISSCTMERDINKDNSSLTLFLQCDTVFFCVSKGTFKPNFRLQHHSPMDHFFLCLISRLLTRR